MFRATLKSLLSRKLRLVLAGLAVVLGVMFVSGSFVLTDTLDRSFQGLFSNVYANVDVQVSTKPKLAQEGGGPPSAVPFPASVVDTVKAVHGAKSAVGGVNGSARPVGKNGKVITTTGAPSFGTNWTGAGQEILREGNPPRADGEVVISGSLAKTGKFAVGDQIGILTLQPKKMFTVVGIYGYTGNRDSLGGELGMAFTEPVAQQLLLGEQGAYSSVTVTAAAGVSQATLRDDVRAAVGGDYDVKTGKELVKATTDQIAKGLGFFNNILLGFAGVALFVGIFIILNTFSILVAQRTRELALLRAVGASRGQVISSVVLEAVVIGLVASVIGLGAGIGVGALLAYVFGHYGGGSLALAGIGVPATAVVSSFAVGIIVSVVASVLPALRASRTAPVAAMRDAATPDRPLTKQTVTGGITLAVGAAALGVGFSGKAGGATLAWILGGILVAFVGVALLTPVISRPVVSVLGRLFSWSLPGKLGRRNSARNPRRTAITAAALMVGIALITGVNVVLASATKSVTKLADTQVKADLIISGQQAGPLPPTFDSAVLNRVAALPGVRTVAGFYVDMVSVNGKRAGVSAANDVSALQRIFGLTAKEGVLGPLASGQVIVDETTAHDANLHVGSTVPAQFARGAQHTLTVAAIYAKTQTMAGWVLSVADSKDFTVPQPAQAFIQLDAGTRASDVQGKIDPLLADSPEVSVQDRSAFVKQQTSGFNTVLTMIQILLALAIIIAVLGVVNTLALSVIERTRELGLLRAIGLRRAQVMRMITVEAVVISVFGALLGVVVGTGLGAATVRALKDQGITEYGFPWTQMVEYVLLAAFVGVIAAILPAIRAARLNVLAAIAHE
jgi:putative ABC transport system permease protein